NLDPATRVAASGAGAPGSETTYFGSLTLAAVKAFQAKHGIITTGYVGPLTRAQLNALYCTPTTTTTVPDGTTTTTTVAGATEGYFTYKLLASPSNGTDVKKGDTNEAIMSFTLEANNSAIDVERIKFNFNKRPWLSVSKIALYEGSNLIKEVEANSSAFEEVTVGSSYNLHLADLGISISKDEVKTFTVKIDVPTNPTNTDLTQIKLDINAIRGVDGINLNVYTPAAASTRTFAIATATTGDLVLSINNNAVDDKVAFISDTETTDNVVLAQFDLKAKYRDVRVTEINNVTVVNNVANDLDDCIPAIELWDGSNMLGSFSTTATNGSETADFTGLELDISKDSTKTLTVKASVAKEDEGVAYITPGDYTNVTLTANNTNIVAEDDLYNTLGAGDISGTLTGKNVYFYTEAPVLSFVSSKISLDADKTDQATGEIVFTVTAQGGDIYLTDNASTTKAITLAETGAVGDATTTQGYSVTGYESYGSNVYKIAQNTTATVTVNGHLDNASGTAEFTGLKISNFKWDESSAALADQNWTWGLEIFKTPDLYLAAS
ncbi:MAG: peptidoglycan-binding domain-containing protein, partial [Candidatus Paceibacterota bacterium]